MNLPARTRLLNAGLLALLVVGMAAGQENRTPVRTVLAHGAVRYVGPAQGGRAAARDR